MKYLDEDIFVDIDFGRSENGPVYYRESGTFEIQVSEMNVTSWETIFKGTFNKSNICKLIPLRFYINDFIRKTDVIDLSGYIGSIQEYSSPLYKYRVVATSEYGDTQTSNPIEVYPAYRNPETLSQMPDGWYKASMSIIRQPMVPHYPANILCYNPTILIYRSDTAPDLTIEEGLWLADSKGLVSNGLGYDFNSLRGLSYFRDTW